MYIHMYKKKDARHYQLQKTNNALQHFSEKKKTNNITYEKGLKTLLSIATENMNLK